MIKDLLYKEFRLAIPTSNWCWLAAVILLLIPGWPFFIVFTYLFFGFFLIVVQTAKANQDLVFSVALPIPKAGIVTARAAMIVAVEVGMLILAVPFAIARYWLYDWDNYAGMNSNLVFFGFILVMLATFNGIYLPGAFKAPDRMLWPVGGGTIIATLVAAVLTTLPVALPSWSILNDRGLGNLGVQLAVFSVCLVVYAGGTFLAYRRAVANFAKVDL